MVNQAAQTLGRLAKGKPKTMSKAAITQRQRAAKASAKARKGRKRGKTLIQVFAEEEKLAQATKKLSKDKNFRSLALGNPKVHTKIIEKSSRQDENAPVEVGNANTKPTESKAENPLHPAATAQREPTGT